MDFVEICNVCTRKVIIKAAKRIFNSDKICCSYYDFYFGVTFFGTHCILKYYIILFCTFRIHSKRATSGILEDGAWPGPTNPSMTALQCTDIERCAKTFLYRHFSTFAISH